MVAVADVRSACYVISVRNNPTPPFNMSEKNKVNLSIGLLWVILSFVSSGAWCAASVYNKVCRIEERMQNIEALEKDMIRVKAKLGMTDASSASDYSTTANR